MSRSSFMKIFPPSPKKKELRNVLITWMVPDPRTWITIILPTLYFYSQLLPMKYKKFWKKKDFENKSSTGLDGISPKILKFLPACIIKCLSHIFNMSLSEGKYVSAFKKAKVIPVHEKKERIFNSSSTYINESPIDVTSMNHWYQ